MKKTILAAFALCHAFLGFTQCNDLFISEYIEGTSNNKAIEIYNPTTVSVPLAGIYQIRIFANGSATPTSTINLTGTIVAGGTYVVAHTSANATILAAAQQTSGSLQHNGNDAIQLYRSITSTSVDVIGIINNDPVTGWTVNGTTDGTLNHTLVRNPTIQQPNLTWTGSGENEWTVLGVDVATGLGAHSMNACGPVPVSCDFTFDDHCFGVLTFFGGGALGGDGNYTYAWDFGDGVGTSTQQNPTYTYAAAGTYTVTLTVTDGASSSDATSHNVVVFPKPSATSVPDVTSGCAPLQVCYTTNVTGGTSPYTFAWSTGNTTQNPCETYSTAGTQNISLYVTDANGCSDTVTNSITVNPLDDASFSYASGSACIADAVMMPTITGLSGGTFTGIGITNSSTGAFDPATAGAGCITINYATNGTCPNNDNFVICVTTQSDATITPVSAVCENEPVFNFTAVDAGGTWTASCGTCINSTSGAFNSSIAGPGTYTITYTISGACGDVGTTNITVNAQDFLNIYNNDTIICNDIFGFFLNAEAGGTWSGIFVNDNTNGDGFFSSASIIPGTYYAVYSTSSSCPFEDSIAITVYSYPSPNFTFSGSLGNISFTNTSTNATDYLWDFDDTNTSNQTNPTHVFALNGAYNVCLTASNAVGCSNTTCQTVNVTGLGIDENTALKMNVYPNPSNGHFTVESSSNITKISVKNIIGQTVFSKNVNTNNALISLDDVNNGFYFIELETENGKAVKRIEITK